MPTPPPTPVPETQPIKLVASEWSAGDNFGVSVAMSSNGSQVVVGAWRDDDRGSESGSAYVFDGATGAQLLKLTAEDGAPYDMFGSSVALSADGAVIAVGSYFAYYYGDSYHYAYVFDGLTGAQLHKLVPENRNRFDMFGCSVAVSSNGARVAVGAMGLYATSYVYMFDVASGAQLLKLTREGVWVTREYFGISVAMSSEGAQVVVGAASDVSDDVGSKSGSAYVFDGATGAQLLKLTAEDGAPWDWFGISVAISADGARIVVGAYYDDMQSGSTYVFDGATGAQLHKLVAQDQAAYDMFGSSVAVSSDGARVAVGTLSIRYQQWGQRSSLGSAYVFDGATGAQVYSWAQGGGDRFDSMFGVSVAMSSDGAQLVVGAPGSGVGETDPGSSYIFMLDGPPDVTTTTVTIMTTVTTNSEMAATSTYSSTASTLSATEDTSSKTANSDVASIFIIAIICCLICCAMYFSPKFVFRRFASADDRGID